MVSQRLVTSSRRAGRVTNKTRLLVVRGSDDAGLGEAETIVWDDGAANGEAAKHQHVGAKGVESGELLEHHLQAALSSASLIHSRTSSAGPTAPSASRNARGDSSSTGAAASTPASTAAGAAASTAAALNYHIPTPDATGLIQNAEYAKLYPPSQYYESSGYIKYSDTVEESSGGIGGLGYCMDDRDEAWLTAFNAKAEGGSGENGSNGSAQSPLKESKAENAMPPPPTIGRPRREKGKEKDKEEKPHSPVFISEDVFEYIMGVLEKHTEDNVPMLHTNLDLMPEFSSIEHLFASPLPASFYPNFEVPRNLPPTKDLVRMAQRIYSHWKERRIERKGKTIMPTLNYDETNDGDPYVCFRRRDVRATRKTRLKDNGSIEKMQKLQVEMKQVHIIAQMVLRRETEKLAGYRAEKEVWEAKWKLYETKKRWPSLGITKEEEELITGRQGRETAMAAAGVVNASMLGGRDPLAQQRENIPSIRRKNPEKEREEREKRERGAIEQAKIVERGLGLGAGARSSAPEVLKERMLALQQQLDEILARRRQQDAEWDDMTDSSYQPLPTSASQHAYRPITSLDPRAAFAVARAPGPDDEELPIRPTSFRLRRGRGGVVHLDRRPAVYARHRGCMPKDPKELSSWLFPDASADKPSRPRPRSIDEDEDEDVDDGRAEIKRRRLNESVRYDVNRGGAVGVGMGITEDNDHIVIDDYDPKYSKFRVGLYRDGDVERLRPDHNPLVTATQALDAPPELPPIPIFNRPPVVRQHDPQMVAQLQQQQMIQQQQMEQFQRYQMMAQQQAMAAQQQAALVAAQQRANGANGAAGSVNGGEANSAQNGTPGVSSPAPNGMHPPNGRPPMKRPPSAQNGAAPNTGAHAQQGRPALSPNAQMHQSPQVNGLPMPVQVPGQPGQKQFVPQPGMANVDPALQQRILAARALQAAQAQVQAQAQVNGVLGTNGANGEELPAEELAKLAAQTGYGNNIQGFLEARNRARMLNAAKQAQAQQQFAQQQQAAQGQPGQQQQQQAQNGTNAGQPFSPQLPAGGLQLKLPPHAAARLGAATQQPQRV